MILANSITLNSDLMDKLEMESVKTGLKIDELVENCLLNNLDKKEDAITLRDIPHTQQIEEIIDYMSEHEVADALEIADALRLDVFDVNDIMAELIKQGILEEL